MDLLTHIALGACMGEAMLGRKIGKRALLWGALAHSSPDIDVVSALWLDTAEELLAHRGITHSITGGIFIAGLFSLIAVKSSGQRKIKPGDWIAFFSLTVFAHSFIDLFNTYGVGLFEPFNNYRVSFNSVYVADPLFSLVPLSAAVALLFIRSKSGSRKVWWKAAFIVSSVYLLVCIINKIVVEQAVKKVLQQEGISYNRYFSTPAPFQNMLWYTVAGNDSGFYVGYRSVFDRSGKMSFQFFPGDKQLLDGYDNPHEIDLLTRFSQQWFTIERWHDTLVFNDLRFGQIAGWYDSSAHFSFHYYLGDSADNKLVMQRGRFQGWDNRSFASLLRKMAGY